MLFISVSLMVVQGEAGEICTVVRGDLNCNIDECASWCSSTYNGNGTCTAINCTCMYPCPRWYFSQWYLYYILFLLTNNDGNIINLLRNISGISSKYIYKKLDFNIVFVRRIKLIYVQ